MGPLDPTLRLARIGTDDIDVQRMQRTAELGHTVAAQRPLIVDAENSVPVAVKGDRLAPRLQVGASRMEITKVDSLSTN